MIMSHQLFLKIKEMKEMIVKIIVAKVFTKIIKFYSKLYLERDINIKYDEILVLLKDYNDTLTHFYNVIKNTLLILLLSYVKSYSSKTYYKLIKYVYNYKTGDVLNSFNNTNAKYYIIDILDNKKWDAFTKPNTYKAILQIYQMNIDNNDIFQKLINEFNFVLIKMFAIWTVASLLENIFLIPILTLILIFYRKIVGKLDNYNTVIRLTTVGISAIVGYFYNNFFVISILCHFGTYLLFNKITELLFKMVMKYTYRLKNYLMYDNLNITVFYLSIVTYMCIFKYNHLNSFVMLLLSILMNIIIDVNIQKQFIQGIILCITYMSDFNILHIIYTSFIVIVIINSFDYSFNYKDLISNISNKVLKILKYLYDKYMDFKSKIKLMSMNRKEVNYNTLEQSNKNNMNSSILKESVSLDDDIFNKSEHEFIKEISVEEEIRQGKQGEYLVKHTNPKITLVDNFFS